MKLAFRRDEENVDHVSCSNTIQSISSIKNSQIRSNSIESEYSSDCRFFLFILQQNIQYSRCTNHEYQDMPARQKKMEDWQQRSRCTMQEKENRKWMQLLCEFLRCLLLYIVAAAAAYKNTCAQPMSATETRSLLLYLAQNHCEFVCDCAGISFPSAAGFILNVLLLSSYF